MKRRMFGREKANARARTGIFAARVENPRTGLTGGWAR
jgi:hypothetical protein